MAFRVSRRSKYLIVLAFISLCLYGSIGRNELSSQPLQTDTKSSYRPPEAKADTSGAAYESPAKAVNEVIDTTVREHSDPADDLTSGSTTESIVAALPEKVTPVIPSKVNPLEEGSELKVDPTTTKDTTVPTVAQNAEQLVPDPASQGTSASDAPGLDKVKFQLGRQEHFPVDPKSYARLPTETPAVIPKIQAIDPSLTESEEEKKIRRARQAEIKDVFKRDWEAYRQFAWMHDELRPVSNRSHDPFGGWGATLVDALDTLIIMDLQDEYVEASAAVAEIDFTYTAHRALPLFEICIRYLGGLLAAYDLGVANGRKDPVMLSQAKILGQVLYGAFDTPNRLPMLKYDYRTQAATQNVMRAPTDGVMSEIGSLSVEFTRLAQLSDGVEGDKLFDAIQRITDAFEDSMDHMVVPGLWPLRLDLSGCKPAPRKFRPTAETLVPAAPQPTTPAVELGNKKEETKIESPTLTKSAPGQTSNSAEQGKTALEKAHEATNSLLDVLDQKSTAAKAKILPVSKRDVTEQTKALGKVVTLDSGPITDEECEKQGIRAAPSSFTQTYSQGALADSTYEYFTKEYLLLGGGPSAAQYRKLYESSIEATKTWLLFKPLVPGDLGAHDLLFSGDVAATVNKE